MPKAIIKATLIHSHSFSLALFLTRTCMHCSLYYFPRNVFHIRIYHILIHIWWMTLCQRYVIARSLLYLSCSISLYFSVCVSLSFQYYLYIHFHISGLSFDLSSVKLVVTLLLKRCSVAMAHTHTRMLYTAAMAIACGWSLG